jgi:hypothetical protein
MGTATTYNDLDMTEESSRQRDDDDDEVGKLSRTREK